MSQTRTPPPAGKAMPSGPMLFRVEEPEANVESWKPSAWPAAVSVSPARAGPAAIVIVIPGAIADRAIRRFVVRIVGSFGSRPLLGPAPRDGMGDVGLS